jgi:hypothetical protein
MFVGSQTSNIRIDKEKGLRRKKLEGAQADIGRLQDLTDEELLRRVAIFFSEV